ncbi:GMC oxidoreductase [Nocardioides donggukensis]|uniref:GMC family oxidoreductase n=1 Tax=Nocardioides donggukensis TaxID=2774019 RepID=A0A927K5K1_9ACTN|nr:GMC family oxidoreductase [Nocardioides donggukensis]MBD8869408.1 GMC family oxidoreductase [Nocardioides donggukensis]
MLRSALTEAAGTDLRCDVCIVGAGPAGLALASRLGRPGRRVLVLESGGVRQTVRAQMLGRGEVVGHPYWPLHTARFRLLGGSGNRWGGMSRPLDASDLEERGWVEHGGWPIDAAELSRHHRETAELLRLTRAGFDVDTWQDLVRPPMELDPDFEHVVYQFSPTKMDYGPLARPGLEAHPHVTVLTDATVTGLHLAPGSARVGHADVSTWRGPDLRVTARAFVLAAGGIENPRLLLASTADRPAGLGNEHDVVGRYFMEHLHVPAGHLLSPHPRLRAGFHALRHHPSAGTIRGALATSARAQARDRLLATSLVVEAPGHPDGQPFLSWSPRATVYAERALRRLAARRPTGDPGDRHPLRDLGGRAWYRATATDVRASYREAVRVARDQAPAVGVHALYARAEQTPQPESRVTLGTGRDAFGMPRARLDWRLHEQDLDSLRRTLALLDGRLRREGLGRLVPPSPGWEERVIGGPHHMGTTRMADDPRRGVVDADCRVHGVPNLWVAGSSVFPTGGYANPTFPLLALSLRLGDHLDALL